MTAEPFSAEVASGDGREVAYWTMRLEECTTYTEEVWRATRSRGAQLPVCGVPPTAAANVQNQSINIFANTTKLSGCF